MSRKRLVLQLLDYPLSIDIRTVDVLASLSVGALAIMR
jgi:hypothetical protein